jgi:hypothetical protein
MTRYRYLFTALIVLILVSVACYLPLQISTPSQPDVQTTVTLLAMTIQAQQGAPVPAAATESLPAVQPSSPTITLTPTPSIPMVRVSEDTNCRSGPGKDFDHKGVLLTGEQAEVVGKNESLDYWIIKNPDSSGTCWLWGRYATVEGDVSGLPEIESPPTPTPATPKAPTGLSAAPVCKTMLLPAPHLDMTHVDLTWTDKADNEDGYNIYRDGNLIDTLGPNSESYAEDPPDLSHTYQVEAFNAAGASAKKNVSVSCP